MPVDLTNPQSIAQWYAVHPQRHGQQIAAFARLWPQFKAPIAEARALIQGAKSK